MSAFYRKHFEGSGAHLATEAKVASERRRRRIEEQKKTDEQNAIRKSVLESIQHWT